MDVTVVALTKVVVVDGISTSNAAAAASATRTRAAFMCTALALGPAASAAREAEPERLIALLPHGPHSVRLLRSWGGCTARADADAGCLRAVH